jgi:hypothetical protein
MGRKSREHRERRERNSQGRQLDRPSLLEEEWKGLKDGDVVFSNSSECPAEFRETNQEDILAFESVESGTSLFDGLQEHGIDLPRPETLDEEQSAEKIGQVLLALMELQIFLIGFENMSARKFYRMLWSETLWEGCYLKKRIPGALTIIDVSHSMPRSEILELLEQAVKANSVQ